MSQKCNVDIIKSSGTEMPALVEQWNQNDLISLT